MKYWFGIREGIFLIVEVIRSICWFVNMICSGDVVWNK